MMFHWKKCVHIYTSSVKMATSGNNQQMVPSFFSTSPVRKTIHRKLALQQLWKSETNVSCKLSILRLSDICKDIIRDFISIINNFHTNAALEVGFAGRNDCWKLEKCSYLPFLTYPTNLINASFFKNCHCLHSCSF